MNNIISEINFDSLAGNLVLIVALVIFCIAVTLAAVYFIGKYNEVKSEDSEKVGKLKTSYVLGIVIAAGLVVRLLFVFFTNGYGYTYNNAYDIAYNVFKTNSGFSGFTTNYAGISPLLGYIYALFSGWGVALGIGKDDIMMQFFVKLPYILADVLLCVFIYWAAKKYTNKYVALALSAFVFLNPLVFVMSSLWGSEYSLYIFVLAVLVYLIYSKNVFGIVLSTCAGCLLSSDMVFIAPIVAVYLLYLLIKAIIKIVKTKPTIDKLTKDSVMANVFYVPTCLLIGLMVVYLAALPAYFPDGVVSFTGVYHQLFIKPFLYLTGENAIYYFTQNGLSIYALFTQNYKALGAEFPTVLFGGLFIALIIALELVVYLSKRNRANIVLLLAYVSATIAIYFVGSTEWGLVPSIIMLVFAFMVIKDKRLFKIMGLLSLFVLSNSLFVLLEGNQISSVLATGLVKLTQNDALNILSIILSVFTVLTHIYFTVVTLDITMTKHRFLFTTDKYSTFGECIKGWIRS